MAEFCSIRLTTIFFITVFAQLVNVQYYQGPPPMPPPMPKAMVYPVQMMPMPVIPPMPNMPNQPNSEVRPPIIISVQLPNKTTTVAPEPTTFRFEVAFPLPPLHAPNNMPMPIRMPMHMAMPIHMAMPPPPMPMCPPCTCPPCIPLQFQNCSPCHRQCVCGVLPQSPYGNEVYPFMNYDTNHKHHSSSSETSCSDTSSGSS